MLRLGSAPSLMLPESTLGLGLSLQSSPSGKWSLID